MTPSDALPATAEPPAELPPNWSACPRHLREPGQAWWAWLQGICAQTPLGRDQLAGVFPMALEYAENCDVLADMRTALKSQGLMVSGSRGRPTRNPMLAEIARVQKNQIQLWRSMGLADSDPDVERRRVGRPSGPSKPAGLF